MQRSILFPKPPLFGAPAMPPDAQQVWLSTPAGRVEAWFLPANPNPSNPSNPSTRPNPLLLFTHGNGELIDYWPDEFQEPRSWGVGVLLVEYPGYGRSEGSPSQQSITQAVVAAYDWARSQPSIDPARLIPYGRSLGGGAAAILSLERQVPAMILESSFSSVSAFAARFGAPAFLVRDPFDSIAAVSKFQGPILVLHGDRDDIVPPGHSRTIAAAAKHATLTWMPCGHNDCPRPWREIRAFLEAHKLL
jgi:fermentation-respiration switch protein FrsA (DUF1100 family)